MSNILKWFFWDYDGEDFFSYVFWNVDENHFDINPMVLMWLVVGMIALGVIATIVLLIVRKVSPKVHQNEVTLKRWKWSLFVAVCFIVIGIILVR